MSGNPTYQELTEKSHLNRRAVTSPTEKCYPSQDQRYKTNVRIGFSFLLVFVVLASGSHSEQRLTSPPKKSETANVFGVAQAMRVFYGNYDARKHTAVTRLPKNKTSLSAPGEEQMTVRVLFNSLLGDPGAQTFFLLTYAVPSDDETYYCHACAPVIGMAVFSQNGGKWTMNASNRAVTFAGEFGKPPKAIELVKIGPSHTAAKIVDVGQGNGETTSVLDVLVPWDQTVNLGLQRVIADDDKGLCDPTGLPCYENHRSVSFVRYDDGEYFDMELKLSGIDLPLDDSGPQNRSRKVSGLEVFRFNNGTYKRVSIEGDRTYFDETVARQKNSD